MGLIALWVQQMTMKYKYNVSLHVVLGELLNCVAVIFAENYIQNSLSTGRKCMLR